MSVLRKPLTDLMLKAILPYIKEKVRHTYSGNENESSKPESQKTIMLEDSRVDYTKRW